MNTNPERPIDRWFAAFAKQHSRPHTLLIHGITAPLLLWSLIALLWCVPTPGTLFRPGLWAALAMFGAWMFYYRASRAIGFGMLAVLVAMAWATRFLHDAVGAPTLLRLALGVLIAAWIAQSIGDRWRADNQAPAPAASLHSLLVGPAWILSWLYRRLGLRW